LAPLLLRNDHENVRKQQSVPTVGGWHYIVLPIPAAEKHPMPHRSSRAHRAAYTLALFPVVLASSGAPVHGPSAPVAPPPHDDRAQAGPADSSALTTLLIPCISGTCQVPLHGTPALAPLKPAPPSPANPASETLARR
jgi:hypothetical protein